MYVAFRARLAAADAADSSADSAELQIHVRRGRARQQRGVCSGPWGTIRRRPFVRVYFRRLIQLPNEACEACESVHESV